MQPACFVLPLDRGNVDGTRSLLSELEGSRQEDYARSAVRLRITREAWFLAGGAQDPLLLLYLETADCGRTLTDLAQSDDPFDRWLRQQLSDVAGVDVTKLQQRKADVRAIYGGAGDSRWL
jgi:hypothetical protein